MLLLPGLLLAVLLPVTVVTALRHRRPSGPPTKESSTVDSRTAAQPRRHGASPHARSTLPAVAVAAFCASLVAATALLLALAPAAYVQQAVPHALQDTGAARVFRRRAVGLREARRRLSGGAAPLHFVASDDEAAQQLFEAALAVAYSFNQPQARRLFAQALAADKACACCAWGLAYSSGPFLNMVCFALRQIARFS